MADPFAGLEEVTLPAAAAPAGSEAFAGLEEADDLDLRDEADLTDDDAFSPADYINSNPNVGQDAGKSQKLINVYRARRIRGLEAGKVAKAAVTEAPGIVKKAVQGVGDLVTRVSDIVVQPAANKVLGLLTGTDAATMEDIQVEAGKKQLKGASEVLAGTDSAIAGLGQLAQQGTRKLFGKSPEKSTDSELLDDLYTDAEFAKTMKTLSEGGGDASVALGLDADLLAKEGIVLDKEAIERLSLVDPVTMVAGGGAFKIVGAGGKLLATAASKAGAQAVMTGLKTVAAKSIETAGNAAAATARGAGKVAEILPAKSFGALVGGVKGGSLTGVAMGAAAGDVVKAAAVAGAEGAVRAGEKVAEIGAQMVPGFTGPKTASMARLASISASAPGRAAKAVGESAAQGAVAAAPLAVASDDSATAGAILGGGAALGAIAGSAAKVKGAVAESIAKNYLDPTQITFEAVESPAYGTDKALDASHAKAFAEMTPQEQNMVSAFREAVRPGKGEIYVQDPATYKARIEAEMAKQKGSELTPEEKAQADLYSKTHAEFDGTMIDPDGNSRRVVFLKGSAKGLPHDAGHLFQSLLDPPAQQSLRDAVTKYYTPAQIEAFKAEYARRIGEPEFFSKLGEEAGNAKAADELIAENYGQLFRNTPVTDLAAPRPFLKELGQMAVNAGESLGIDLTAGRTTADLQAQPSLRLQSILRNAAQEVLTRPEASFEGPKNAPPAPPVPAPKPAPRAPIELPAPRSLEMAPKVELSPEAINPASSIPSAGPVPVEPALPVAVPAPTPVGGKNIRTTPEAQGDFASQRAAETGIAEAQKATETNPEVRATVDKIAQSMEAGNPVLEIEHRGITSEGGEGRTSRRGTQEKGYADLEALQVENRKNAPAGIVNLHQKTFVPVRFTTQGGKPTLLAMSLDKVISNIHRVVADAATNKAEGLLPYPVEGGKLTDAGWTKAVADVQTYAENQANGYRGDGQKLTRPADEVGVSIPAENPNYAPKTLTEAEMNFANLLQGLNPPETSRITKGQTPGNVKGQIVAEVNKRQPMTPSVIEPKNVGKQTFKGFDRNIAETNPLRNELAARGVKMRELLEVTERLAVEDIGAVNPRPDINFKAPVTDTIRGGFLPESPVEAELARVLQTKRAAGIDLTETVRRKAREEAERNVRTGKAGETKQRDTFFLPDESLDTIGEKIRKMDAPEWAKWTTENGGLTGHAYQLGLAAPDVAYVVKLAELRDKFLADFRETMATGDLDAAYPKASQSQFFGEAYGAATGGKSARNGLRRLNIEESSIPFPDYETKAAPATVEKGFLPGKEPTRIEIEVTRRLEDKRKAGVPTTEKERLKTRKEVEFDDRNGRLGKEVTNPSTYFLPAEGFTAAQDPIHLAAIRTPKGKIFTGSWHGEALMNLGEAAGKGEFNEPLPAGVKTLSDMLDGGIPDGFLEDGFVTVSGEFLNRAQALDHAEKIKQLKPGAEGKFRKAGVLESKEFSDTRSFLPGDVQPKGKSSPKPAAQTLDIRAKNRVDDDE